MTVSTKLSDIWGAREDIPKCVAPAIVDPFERCADFVRERILTLVAAGYSPDQIRTHLCMTDGTYDALKKLEFGRIRTDRSTTWVRELADTHLPATSLDDHRKMIERRETILS